MSIVVIPTTAAEHIAQKLTYKKGIEVIFPDKNKEGQRYFPDGEIYTRISRVNELKGRTVVLHSGCPNQSGGLIELEMLLEILEKSARPIEVFFTYFPYGQQDDVFQAGETNFAENIVKKLTRYYDVDKIYTIDAHFFGRKWVSKYSIVNISAANLLMQAASVDYPGVIYIAPDVGSQRRTGLKGAKKQRTNSFVTEIQSDEELRKFVKDQVVGTVDDIVETGGTLINFYDKCKEYGAMEIIALITHGVLPDGIKRIQDKYSRLYLTNTILRDEANVDVTNLIWHALKSNL